MELGGAMAGELKGNGAWVPLTPAKSVPERHNNSNNDVGSADDPHLSQILGEMEHPEKENDNCGCAIGNSGSVNQEVGQDCAKKSEDCSGGIARKDDFLVPGNPSSSFGSLGSDGRSVCIVGAMSDNRPYQETIEVEMHFAGKKGSQLHDQNSHSGFGSDSTKASSMPKNQTPKRRSKKCIDLNKKQRKRLKMKRHRPKVFDESKPIKPSTPKPQPPKRTKCVKKESLGMPVDPLKDVDHEAVSDESGNSCRQKLDFSMENCIVNQNMKICDGVKNIQEEEPELESDSRFKSLRSYQRIFRPNECLKNSRKLGPNCPKVFKKTRSRRQRATVFDKFIRLVSKISPTRIQRRAAMVARKLFLLVSGNPGSSFQSSESHGKPEVTMSAMSDNRPHQHTIELEVPFAWKKESELHNHSSHCEFGSDSTKASTTPKNQIPKKRSNNGIDSNKKPQRRSRMKRHRPKVFDESKPMKPSTPEPRTPKRTKYVKKDNLETLGDPLKDVDLEAISDSNRNSCRQKLDFSMENCMVNQDSKVCDGIKNIPEEEPTLDSSSRCSSLRVYQRTFRPKECLKNSRKLGPNCPRIFKKTRSRRQRATVFDKFIRLVSMIPPTQRQRQAATKGPMNLSSVVKARKKKSRTLSQRQKSLSARVSMDKMTREAIQHPTFEKCTSNLTWNVNSKRKRSKTFTPRRDLSFFVNDISKNQVSESGVLEASSIRTPDTFSCTFAPLSYHEYQYKYGRNDLSACLQQQEDTMLKCMEHSLESDIVSPHLVGRHHEKINVFPTRDYDAFTQALVDFATQRMECLHIDDRCNQLVVRDENAQGVLVPSKGKFDPSKKRKPLPKVDLDAETMRVWNLLMENSGGEDIETEDADDKAKYWKEQREVFRGRVDSFIARMHLFQGDRRFSPWKGSVVDSVVGVFLTQNVSDHLSSSAFMSLAARYPPPSVSEKNGCNGGSDHAIHETQQVKIAEPSSGKCKELLMIKNYPSSRPSNKVGLDPENENKTSPQIESTSRIKKGKVKDKQENTINWDDLRKKVSQGTSRKRMDHTIDSVNWEAVRQAPVQELAKVIMERGMNNVLAGRIKDFLDRIVRDHGSIDLEWLRDIPPDKAKEYLLSIPGLGLKSVECVRLLTLHHHAFPVDTNVGRILVRLGWVPLQPLPEDVQIHLLNQYPLLDTIQKYIWPRLCTREQPTLYELHYQMITFGKAFCTKKRPNCNACPMRGECRHYASALASAKLRLEGPRGETMATESPVAPGQNSMVHASQPMLSHCADDLSEGGRDSRNCEPIVEVPASPEPVCTDLLERDIEDFDCEFEDEIPTIKLNSEEFTKDAPRFMGEEDGSSRALVALSPGFASNPMPQLKYVSRLRTVHHVYELPDSHPLLAGFEKREPDDPCPYLLTIWMTDETTNSSQESRKACNCHKTTCDMGTSCSGETVLYQNDRIVQGTILIPCRTANRGSFPLNGTYFQVNEVFADHESSRHPIAVPREWIWNLRRRALYCGTSVTSISRGLSLEEITYCFRKGFICVRGIDRTTRAARPLARRFHLCKTRQVDDE